MRGRKPTPSALHLLRGNPGKRPRPALEPQPPPLVDLAPPAWLSDLAAVEWRRLAPVLVRLRVLTDSDTDALAAYCEAFVTWHQATQQLRADGLLVDSDSGPRMSPYVKIAQQSLVQMRALLVELGMTPSARARVKVIGPDAKPLSKWAGLL